MIAATYDNPLPTLSLESTELSIDTGSNSQGNFTIKNTGGGTLSGHVFSRQRGLTFSPTTWEGNNQIISYKYFQASPHNTSIIKTQVLISSNGGEVILPTVIDTSPMIIDTDEGARITSITDFYHYFLEYPAAARRLFISSEFYMLLMATGYPYLEVYESLHKDPNRERALDNFFQLSSLKDKTHLFLETYRLDIYQHPLDISETYFYVMKTDGGYADAPITCEKNMPWLTLSCAKLVTSDFDHSHKAAVGIEIDPEHMPGYFCKNHIKIGTEVMTLTVRKAPRFVLEISREGFRYEDRGTLEIENNTGFDMTIEVHSRDRYVRFFRAVYTVPPGPFSIPFEIRPSAFLGTRRLFTRIPYISTYVDVRARSTAQVYNKRLHLSIGEW